MEEPAPVLVYVIAGEDSGDALASRLMREIAAQSPDPVCFAGIGGSRMTAAGLEPLFPMAELSLMGLAEVLPHVPRLLRRIRQAVADILERRPDVLVTVDSPGFAFRVIARLRKAGARDLPCVHYVAPQVWAWRPGRAAKVARLIDHLVALLPFEPPYFERVGLPTTFVGHPVIEGGAGAGDGPGFRGRHGLDATRPVLCVLPGSRRGEVDRLMPIFGEAVDAVRRRSPALTVVLPAAEGVADRVAELAETWTTDVLIVRGEAEKYDAFAASDIALAASGTVSLELAIAHVPTVIAYRMSPVTAWLGRRLRLLRVRYVTLVNLLVDRMAMPECLQEECVPDRLSRELGRLLDDRTARQAQREAFDQAVGMLSGPGPTPSAAAARVVLEAGHARRDSRQV
ncbi:MAG: lipid-A-disaccharide synthase [Acetobacterales bacterium]